MKKLLLLAPLAVIVFSALGCGSSDSADTDAKAAQPAPAPAKTGAKQPGSRFDMGLDGEAKGK